MKKSDYYKRLIISLGIMLYGSSAEALIPTVDANAIAEGVKTNVELVKQSKVVVEATKLTGEIKSVTGSAKAALSDLENSEAMEEVRKAQKEVENLQEAAATYQEYKEKIEQEKENLENNKKKLDKFKEKATNAYNTVKEKYDEAKDFYDDAKVAYEDAKEFYDEAKGTVDTYVPQIKAVTSNVKETISQGNSQPSQPQTITYETSQNSSSVSTPVTSNQELEAAQEEIEQLKQALAALMAQQGQISESEQLSIESAGQITDLSKAQAEIEKLKAELEKYKSAENQGNLPNIEKSTSQLQTGKALVSKTQSEIKIKTQENSSLQKATEEVKENAEPQKIKTFRKIPNINTNEIFDKTSYNEIVEPIYTASRTYREVLKFAKEETESPAETTPANVPTGKNTKTDEFIMSEELAQYCGINVNNASESELSDCVKKLIEYRSSSNATEAEKAEKLIKKVLYDTSTALVAESMLEKAKGDQYKEETLAEKEKGEASAKTSVRDDISALSSNVAILQELIANINKIYASRLMAESLKEATKYKLQDIGETPSETTGKTAGE